MNLTYFLIHKSNIKIWHELSDNHSQSDAMAAQFTYYVHKIAWHNWLNKLMEKYHREFWTHMAWNWFFNESLPNHHNPLMTRMVGLWPPFFTPQLFHSWMMMSLSYLTRLPKKSCLSNRILHFLTMISHNILKTNPIKINNDQQVNKKYKYGSKNCYVCFIRFITTNILRSSFVMWCTIATSTTSWDLKWIFRSPNICSICSSSSTFAKICFQVEHQ